MTDLQDFSVHLTYEVDPEADVEAFADASEDEAVVSFGAGTWTVALDVGHVVHALEAANQGDQFVHKWADNAGIQIGRLVATDVTTWDERERQVNEPNYPDLVSAPEVAEILGVSRQRVHQLVSENRSFPEPFMRLGSGPLWLRSTIEAFERSWPRKPGRPRSH